MPMARAQLETYRGRGIPDVVGNDVRLLIVGENPGLRSAAAQASFADHSNRFYPTLYRAGITDRIIDTSNGFDNDDLNHLHLRGVGLTTLVNYATARANELSREELIAGEQRLRQRVVRVRPRLIAVLGVSVFRIAFQRRNATLGPQDPDMGGTPLWVIPNPSGLNARYSLNDLAAHYRAAAIAAGIDVFPPPLAETKIL
jgi:double-stranded uracil-DNA glycosylase